MKPDSKNPFEALRDIAVFCEHAGGIRLRGYQREVAQAVLRSVLERRGHSLVVIFPRQSGKNELQAQLEAYLLAVCHRRGAEIIKVSPTFKPQTENAMRRLERVLERNQVTAALGWEKESGYIYRVGRARAIFLSGDPQSNIVGATASTLLEVDEAQDVEIAKYDKDIAPMAASTNATRVFWGTAWTSTTLLARELRAAQEAERRDGLRRVWQLSAAEVAAEVPAYAVFVADQVSRLGRQHPLVKTQFFSEEIDTQAGLFPPMRRALLEGSHAPRSAPQQGQPYALLLDVAGQDEEIQLAGQAAADANTRRDATALTVVEVDLAGLADPLLRAPRYRVMARQLWVGLSHTDLYARVRGQVEHWQARCLVVDASGIGAGLAAFLAAAFPGRVLPFTFTSASKSKLGWDFIGLIEAGRFKDYCIEPGAADEAARLKALFMTELEHTCVEMLPGPGQLMRWGTPDGLTVQGQYIHDDLVLSAALCAVLDSQAWAVPGPTLIINKPDPLKELDHGF